MTASEQSGMLSMNPLSSEQTDSRENFKPANGSSILTLVGTVLTGCMGLATAVLLSNTRNHLKPKFMNGTNVTLDHPVMPILHDSDLASVIFIAAPNLSGSLMRIPFSVLLESVSTRLLHVICMTISFLGILGLLLVSWLTASMVELSFTIYVLYVVCGVIGGFGCAVFSVGIATVAFWSPQSKQGTMNGIYGGLTNLAPGLMGLWVTKAIVGTSLTITYVIWLSMLLVVVLVSTPMIFNSPYHQLMFRKQKKCKAAGVKAEFTEEEVGRMKGWCTENYEQQLFPTGNALESLKNSAKNIRTWALVYLYNVSFGGYLALTVYFPSFYVDAFGISTEVAGYLGSLFTLIAACYRVLAGFISDKIKFMNGGVFIEILAMSKLIIGSLIMIISRDFTLNVIGMVIMAFAIGGGNAATYKILPNFCPDNVASTSGLVAGLGAFGGLVWPIVMAAIRSAVYIHMEFVLYVVLACILLLVLAWIFFTMRRDAPPLPPRTRTLSLI